MTTTSILASIAPEHRETARPVVEAHIETMREMAAKMATLMAQTRKMVMELGR